MLGEWHRQCPPVSGALGALVAPFRASRLPGPRTQAEPGQWAGEPDAQHGPIPVTSLGGPAVMAVITEATAWSVAVVGTLWSP